jgi:hypothetical protein
MTARLQLFCGRCYRVVEHVDVADHEDRDAHRYIRKRWPTWARHIRATCTVCGRRDASGYVIEADK